MKDIIIWFFERLVEVVQFSLDFKIYGDFSLLHFVLAFNFLIILFKFFRFGTDTALPESVNFGLGSYRNYENKKERQAYADQKQKEANYRESYDYYKKNRLMRENYSKRYRNEMKNK